MSVPGMDSKTTPFQRRSPEEGACGAKMDGGEEDDA